MSATCPLNITCTVILLCLFGKALDKCCEIGYNTMCNVGYSVVVLLLSVSKIVIRIDFLPTKHKMNDVMQVRRVLL